jgi:hypothetical protein
MNKKKSRKLNAPVSTLSTSTPPTPIYYLNFWFENVPLDKHPAASMVFGAIWALKKPS